MPNEELKELWVDWTHDALGAVSVPEDIEDDPDDVADYLVAFAVAYANSMLDEYEAQFTSKRGTRRSKPERSRKKKDEDDDLDD